MRFVLSFCFPLIIIIGLGVGGVIFQSSLGRKDFTSKEYEITAENCSARFSSHSDLRLVTSVFSFQTEQEKSYYDATKDLQNFVSYFVEKNIPITSKDILEGGEELDKALLLLGETKRWDGCTNYFNIIIEGNKISFGHRIRESGWKKINSLEPEGILLTTEILNNLSLPDEQRLLEACTDINANSDVWDMEHPYYTNCLEILSYGENHVD